MIQRLAFVIAGCAVLAAALALVCHLLFPDVVAYMPGEEADFGWQREAAFMITALAWIAAEFAVVLSVVLAGYLWKSRSARIRAS